MLPTLFFLSIGAVGASFVSVLSERAHTGASWATGRSRCDSCATELTAQELIPVVSWLISRGVCRTCGSRIPVRLFVTEVITALVFALAYTSIGLTSALLFFLCALLVLLYIVLYDIRHTIVSMRAVGLFVLSALSYAILAYPASIGLTLLSAGLAASVFLLFHILSRGRAMGLGDTPVVLGLSLMVTPVAIIPGILFSFWSGAVYGLYVLMRARAGERHGIEVPFIPFLVFGFLLAFFTGWNPLPLFL